MDRGLSLQQTGFEVFDPFTIAVFKKTAIVNGSKKRTGFEVSKSRF